jgi:tetratricopeptide (TPR) repeat protein
MERCRDQVEPFLEDLHGWEQNPDLYRRDETLNRRLDDRFLDLLLAMVRNQLDTAPVYVTQDVALNRSPQDLRFAQSLAAAYQLVPQGLIFQLVSGRAFREPATIRLVTRGLADDTLRFEPDDVVRLKVSPVYVSMLYNRGRYFSLFGHHAEAVEAFRQALALDPRFAPAQTALAGSLNALRKAGQAPP